MRRDVWVFLFLSFLSFFISRHSIIIVVAVAVVVPTSNASSPYSSQHPNHASECNALLQFSQSFTSSRDASALYCDILHSTNTSYPKTALWQKGTDCCSWDGVACHMSKDYVIGFDLSCSWLRGALHSNSTLFSLRNLQRLNLAGNNFAGSQISSRFGILTRLAHLNLSCSSFSGIIPLEMISRLSSLISLDISVSSYSGNLTMEEDRSFRRFISNLTQLRELALDRVDMSRISLTSFTNLSSTLTSLSLVGCSLQGTFPINIFHLPNLGILSLSSNNDLTGTLPQTNWSSSPLVLLSLSLTKFHGPIPDSVGNLTSLEFLDLQDGEFTGSVPPTLGNLDRLSYLGLGAINLSGTVDFDKFARLKNLEYLYLSENLSVMLPNTGNCSFPKLKYLTLRGVNLTSTFPYFLSSSPELKWLDLSENKISGPIPEWFGRVWSNTLSYLDLFYNNFTGEIPFSICQLTPLTYLSLSNNRLNGTIPRCLGNLSNLYYLLLGDNLLQGPLPRSLANGTSLGNSHVELVDLANNNFDGPLPIPPPSVQFYSIANNKFSGDILHQLCNATLLDVVNLSNNSFTGSIPHCLINLNASALDLRANKLAGQIPDIFFSGNNLRTIRLSQNRLEGTVPRSLANCKNLEVLDLGENELEDRFPYWLDTLPNLQVLNLDPTSCVVRLTALGRIITPFRSCIFLTSLTIGFMVIFRLSTLPTS
ncbi:receptor-like protein 7 isoform X1 [Punica granatum]|uniref:Receptor-like protein 7 isoform X1 n=1 Tax=Punica granatum TaxID=22663 RepID=A0A6P8ED40_PUNGR|nr:receptor-like protein 7 isoform X1 [Punica granatum]